MTVSEVTVNLYIGVLSSLIAALIIAVIAWFFKYRIKRFFLGATLKSAADTPTITLDIESVKNERDEWITLFLIENVGSVDVNRIKVFLCSNNFPSNTLTISPIVIDDVSKWVNDKGQKIQINTRSLHDGCNVTEDQRYFVELIDENSGTIYRAARGAPSAKDGSMPSYATKVCRKRLPRRGLRAIGEEQIDKFSKKYDIDLALG